jgi:putative membrane protein
MELPLNFFPKINASLNALAAFFLFLGWFAIKFGNVKLHRVSMATAFGVSAVFLASYLYYHFHFPSQKFQGLGWSRNVYFPMLISHIILAVAILPFIFRILFLAYRQRFAEHARLARWVWPLWIYTSVTGVLIYFFLYVWFPAGTEELLP